MTRKKSNVKALALAVTCAILAGGYSGLNPVYAAADTLYKDGTNVTTSNTPSTGSGSNSAIEQLTVGDVTIGGTGTEGGQIIAKNIVGITNTGETTPSAISINGATFANGGAITANGGLTTNSVNIGGLTISSLDSGSTTSATNYIAGIKDSSGSVTAIGISGTKFESNGAITATSLKLGELNVGSSIEDNKNALTKLGKKTANLSDDGNTLSNMTEVGADKVSATTLEVDGKEITAEKVDKYDAAVSKTAKITQNTDGSTTVNDVTFKAGAVSGVTSINGKIEISNDGKTVTFNKDVEKGQVEISEKGIKVGTGSTYISGDAVYTGGADYDAAKAGMKNDGSLKAAGGAFKVDTAGKVTTTGDIEGRDITAKGNLSVTGTSTFTNGIKTDTIDEKTPDAGVTVNRNKITTDNKFNDVELKGGNVKATDITATGALKGQTLGIGAANTEFVVDANGNITKVTSITADENELSTIGGVKLEGKKVTADNLEIGNKITTKDLEVTGAFSVGDFTTNNLTVNTKLTVGTDTKLTEGELVLGTDAKHTLTKAKLKTINETINDTGEITTEKATIGGNTIIDSTGITSNSVTATTGTIGGITLNNNDISGVTKVTAGEFNVNGNNFLNSTGITASKGTVGGVTIESNEVKANKFTAGASSLEAGNLVIDGQNSWTAAGIKANDIEAGSATIGTNTTINNIGISTIQVKLGDMTITDGNITDNNGVTINGVELKANAVTASGGFAVNTDNKLDAAGLTAKTGTFADSVTIGSSLTNQTKVDQGMITVKGNAGRSTAAGTETTIDGGVITTDTLNVQRIELGEKLVDSKTGATITDSSIYLNHDGSFGAAKGAFQIDTDGQVTNKIIATGTDASETTFTSSKTGITAKYRKGTGTATSGLTIDDNHAALNASGGAALDLKNKIATLGIGTDSLTTYTSDTIESKVGTDASRTLKADEIVDKVGSSTVTTNNTGTTFSNGTNTTLINGSSITSTKATGDTGVLNGSNLTLTDATGAVTRSTALTAGGVTFTGADGRSDATGVKNQTTIDGGIITTDTLNVQRIELGDKLVDGNGTPLGGNLSMDEYGNIKAAGGKFTVAGTNQTNPGALHNEVGGKTFLDTTETGASMKFDNTAATDGVKSEVSVEANKATVAAGDKASFVANTDNGGTATITGGTQTVTTTGAGTVFNNSAHNTPFGGGIVTETTINGNEITTGKITTDQLVIKGNGSGNADGTGSTPGSIALGGNGSITSNIIAGTQEATFKTDETGTFTEAKDGANKTTNTVNAQGNTNEVTDGTNTSTATQTATAIGGVITNGTVKLAEAELNKDGFTVKQDGKTDVKISDGDVTVTNNKNAATPNQKVQLSDLGSLNNLDGELTARDEYKNNQTAVGAINAEAGIRREEVARLDNRIDDVNNRVDKVGAMAAAIASLKSIGYDPQAPSEFSIGLGQYKGETGVAMGFFHYPNKNFMINVSLSTAGGETMGGIGATWRFGHKSPQKLLEEQREAQAKKELAAAEKYQAAAKLAKEAQERAEYAAKLARQAQVSADNAKAAADATQAKHFQ